MRALAHILLGSALLLSLGMARVASAQRPLFSALPPSPSAERGGQAVDGILERSTKIKPDFELLEASNQ